MKRHIYKPPKGTYSAIFAIVGGLLATLAVFVAIPLSQKLNDLFQKAPSYEPDEITVEPPDTTIEEQAPPPEEEPEPEPEEMVEQSNELDFTIDLTSLGGGTGSFLVEIPKFAMKGADDVMGGDLDSPPTPVSKTQPTYPSSLLKKGVGGKVLITCTVDATGRVISTTIKQSSGQPELDKAAINAVNKWKFKPGVKGGKPVKATCVVPFNFEVKKS